MHFGFPQDSSSTVSISEGRFSIDVWQTRLVSHLNFSSRDWNRRVENGFLKGVPERDAARCWEVAQLDCDKEEIRGMRSMAR